MTAEVIETKRSPPIWSVKVGHRYKVAFLGNDARAKAEAYAAENFGAYTVVAKPVPAREQRRLAALPH
jgi:hypothetical protein